MNLRVPEDLDRRLDQLAAEEHTSKSALLFQGAELVLQRHRCRREIGEGLDSAMNHDAGLLTRLEAAWPRTSRLRTRCRSLTGMGSMPVTSASRPRPWRGQRPRYAGGHISPAGDEGGSSHGVGGAQFHPLSAGNKRTAWRLMVLMP